MPDRVSKIARAAHSIKGTAANLMCRQLHIRARIVEDLLLSTRFPSGEVSSDEAALSSALVLLEQGVDNFKESVRNIEYQM